MRLSLIKKLYLSNFLTGLIFWYGIEKLFMKSIGIDAVGVGIATAIFLVFNLIFDIPAGILADKWSRKGMLCISVLSLAIGSVILGLSNGLLVYVIGYLFYGVYVVSSSGTYQAMTYDILHQEGRTKEYSRVTGLATALFLASTGVANIASGFLVIYFGYRVTFFMTVISCIANALLLLSIKEPTFHKAERKERIISQLSVTTKTIANIRILRGLAIIMSALAVVELFKIEFGQLYMLRYISTPQLLGLLWAIYAFTWSLGNFIAHRLKSHLNALVWLTTTPLILMAFIDGWVSLILFMIQAVAAAALLNQIETRIQESTPSHVRASVLSILSSIGRAVSIPASLLLGWIFHVYNAYWALVFIAAVATVTLLYWLWVNKNASPRVIDADITRETVKI